MANNRIIIFFVSLALLVPSVQCQCLDNPCLDPSPLIPDVHMALKPNWKAFIYEDIPIGNGSFISNFIVTNKGTIIVAGAHDIWTGDGGNYNAYAAEMSIYGDVIWAYELDSEDFTQFYGMAEIDDNYLFVGRASEGEDGDKDIFLLTIDTSGSIVREETIESKQDEIATSVVIGKDGHLYIAGYTDENNSYEPLLMKYGQDGELIWRKTIHSPDHAICYKMMNYNGGLAMMCANKSYDRYPGVISLNSQIYVINVDYDGNITWSVLKGAENGYSMPMDISATIDGGIVLTGFELQNREQKDMFFMKIGPKGGIENYTVFSGLYENDDIGYDIIELQDGNLLIHGDSCHWILGSESFNAWYVCDSIFTVLDPHGNVLGMYESFMDVTNPAMPYTSAIDLNNNIVILASGAGKYGLYFASDVDGIFVTRPLAIVQYTV